MLSLLLALSPLQATDTLLRDLSPGPESGPPQGSAPFALAQLDSSRALFGATVDGVTDLYVSDGTAAGTLQLTDASESLPQFFGPSGTTATLSDGRLVFEIAGATGTELGVTDGTPAGTEAIADLTPGSAGSFLRSITGWNGNAYVLADLNASGAGVWRTDGSAAGTSELLDLDAIAPSNWIAQSGLAALPNSLLLLLNEFGGTSRLITLDGTAGAFQQIASFQSSTSFTSRAFGGRVAFMVPGGPPADRGLYATDGTAAGTVRLLATDSTLWFQTSGNRLFFGADDPATSSSDYVLGVSDGTPAGTTLLNHKLLPFGSTATYAAPLGLGIVFNGFDFGGPGAEPWYSDGTEAGTMLLADIRPGSLGSVPNHFTPYGNEVVFSASTPATGRELWITDGTPAGTRLVEELEPGAEGLEFLKDAPFLEGGGKLLLPLNDGTVGREMFVTQASPGTTEVLLDLVPNLPASSNPELLTRLGDRLIFAADDGVHGRELWISDGTPGGTVLLADIAPGPASGGPTEMVRLGDQVIFDANGEAALNNRELWCSDGTPEGTRLLLEINAQAPGAPSLPQQLTVLGDRVVFVAYDARGWEIWTTDGTTAGTEITQDLFQAPNEPIFPGPLLGTAQPRLLGVSDDQAFYYWKTFPTSQGTVFHLVATDGTPAGTAAFFEPENAVFQAAGGPDFLAFSYNNPVFGFELWGTDGTTAGTGLIKDINPSTAQGSPQNLYRAGDRVVFNANDGTGSGFDLWSTDGTEAGTVKLVTDLRILDGPSSTDPQGPLDFLAGAGTANGWTLWRTDGSIGGTQLLHSWTSGQFAAAPMERLGTGNVRLFEARDSLGAELWAATDDPLGAVPLADSLAGSGSGSPTGATRAGDTVFFAAEDGVAGRELHAIPFTALLTPLIQPFGTSCSASGLAVDLDAAGAPTLGGASALTLADAPPGAPAFLFYSSTFASAELTPGCSLYLADPKYVGAFATDGLGAGSLAVGAPSNPAIVGLPVAFQAAVSELQGPALGFALSNGLEVLVGP